MSATFDDQGPQFRGAGVDTTREAIPSPFATTPPVSGNSDKYATAIDLEACMKNSRHDLTVSELGGKTEDTNVELRKATMSWKTESQSAHQRVSSRARMFCTSRRTLI